MRKALGSRLSAVVLGAFTPLVDDPLFLGSRTAVEDVSNSVFRRDDRQRGKGVVRLYLIHYLHQTFECQCAHRHLRLTFEPHTLCPRLKLALFKNVAWVHVAVDPFYCLVEWIVGKYRFGEFSVLS